MQTVGFNLKKALKTIGINKKETNEILDDSAKALFATSLLFNAFSSLAIIMLELSGKRAGLNYEDFAELHNNSLMQFFPGVFYKPDAEDAEAAERKFMLEKTLSEIRKEN